MTDIVVDPLRAPITRPHTHIHRHTVWVTRGALYYCIVLDWMWAKINWHADFILFIIWQINRKSWDRRESPLVPVRSPVPSSSFVQPCKLLSGVCVCMLMCVTEGAVRPQSFHIPWINFTLSCTLVNSCHNPDEIEDTLMCLCLSDHKSGCTPSGLSYL